MEKKHIGLTGGIASGKSTVSAMFASLGIPIVDADLLAREVVLPGTVGHEEVVAAFGRDYVRSNGEIDRAKLAERIFVDAEAREKLNAILHPKISVLSHKKLQALNNTTAPYVIYSAALLIENNGQIDMDRTIVVFVDPATQLKRLCERDGLLPPQAKVRIQSQMPLQDKVNIADDVIDNRGTLEETKIQVQSIHRRLSKVYGSF